MGTAGPGGNTVDGAFVDADHDGDLDLFLIRADGTNVLLNNDGNGKFRDISAQAGIGGDGSGQVRSKMAGRSGQNACPGCCGGGQRQGRVALLRRSDPLLLSQGPTGQVLLVGSTWARMVASAT